MTKLLYSEPQLHIVSDGLFPKVMLPYRQRVPRAATLLERLCSYAEARLSDENSTPSVTAQTNDFLKILDYEVLHELAVREGSSYATLERLSGEMARKVTHVLCADIALLTEIPLVRKISMSDWYGIIHQPQLRDHHLGWRWSIELGLPDGEMPDPQDLYDSMKEEWPPEALFLEGTYKRRDVKEILGALYTLFPNGEAILSLPVIKIPEEKLEGWVNSLLLEFLEELEDGEGHTSEEDELEHAVVGQSDYAEPDEEIDEEDNEDEEGDGWLPDLEGWKDK
ncbi:hypothetical protein J4410_06465 [Candidatus Woesearchaeota archaeon]|nr:hypothetical protein [Candidatus Woesearchaeota archaeon]